VFGEEKQNPRPPENRVVPYLATLFRATIDPAQSTNGAGQEKLENCFTFESIPYLGKYLHSRNERRIEN
jgi:hypothetical protein